MNAFVLAPTRKRLVGICALAAMMALGACSSSSKPSSSSSPSTSASSPSTSSSGQSASASGAPIKVGVICACAGAFGPFITPAVDVYKAWADSVNASGGIDGHPIQLIVEDDQGTPGTSVSDAQTLVSDHVDAMVDVTIYDTAWSTAVQQANVPVIGVLETNTPFYTNPDFYAPGQTNNSVTYSEVSVVKQTGATNFGSIATALGTPGPQYTDNLLRAAGQKLGEPLVYTAAITPTAPNFTAQCVAAQQAHVQALIISDSSPDIIRVAHDCALQGYHPIYITQSEGDSTNLLTSTGLTNSWEVAGLYPYFINSPVTQGMTAAMAKYYPSVSLNSTDFTGGSAQAWASGVLLRDAIKAGGLGPTGTPSAAEVVRGLESLKGDTLGGWTSPLTIVAGQAHLNNCWFTVKAQNGVPQLANNGHPSCESS